MNNFENWSLYNETKTTADALKRKLFPDGKVDEQIILSLYEEYRLTPKSKDWVRDKIFKTILALVFIMFDPTGYIMNGEKNGNSAVFESEDYFAGLYEALLQNLASYDSEFITPTGCKANFKALYTVSAWGRTVYMIKESYGNRSYFDGVKQLNTDKTGAGKKETPIIVQVPIDKVSIIDTEREFQLREREAALRDALKTLEKVKPLQAEVLTMVYYRQHTYAEVANELGIKLEKAKSLAAAGRKYLRENRPDLRIFLSEESSLTVEEEND